MKRGIDKFKFFNRTSRHRSFDKKAQIHFGWIFAVLVGGAILFFAIYGAMKTGDTQRLQTDSQVAKSISVLTDPLQAGFSEGSKGEIHFKKITRINNNCYDNAFGRNDLSVSTRSDIGKEWNTPGVETSIYNKYIFSKERTEAKDFYVFSKPLELPYKIADLIFLISDNYCFLQAPEEIADELSSFNIPAIQVETKLENCTLPNQTIVCFRARDPKDCDMFVHDISGEGIITKGKSEDDDIQYTGEALMYAVIFSDKINYQCNVQRLLYRGQIIADELTKKSALMSSRGCQSSINQDLTIWKQILNSTSPDGVKGLYTQSIELNDKNERERCNLW